MCVIRLRIHQTKVDSVLCSTTMICASMSTSDEAADIHDGASPRCTHLNHHCISLLPPSISQRRLVSRANTLFSPLRLHFLITTLIAQVEVEDDVLEYLRRLVLSDEHIVRRFRNLISTDYNRILEKCLRLSRYVRLGTCISPLLHSYRYPELQNLRFVSRSHVYVCTHTRAGRITTM